jgi:hypothetical protein
LTVREIVREKWKETKALCDCDCGTQDVIVSVYRLKMNEQKSTMSLA